MREYVPRGVIESPYIAECAAEAEKPYRGMAMAADDIDEALRLERRAEVEGARAQFTKEALLADGIWRADKEELDIIYAEREARHEEWLRGLSTNDEHTLEAFRTAQNKYNYLERSWLEEFSGKIPVRWAFPSHGSGWHKFSKDLRRAGQLGVQLHHDFIEAGINHPHWAIVEDTAITQKLSPLQLAKALVRLQPRSRQRVLVAKQRPDTPAQDVLDALIITKIMEQQQARQHAMD